MLTFPDEFFYDEVRSDFFVPAMMKCTWAAELKVLEDLRELWDKYGLRWYADFGTLLGAVRHNGFIPWDDDIDITMPRKDFMIFLEHASELKPPNRILSIYSSDTFYQFHAVATNNIAPKLEWDTDRLRDYYRCPFIINLDIYPLDTLPDDPKKRDLQALLYRVAYQLVHRLVSIETREAKGEVLKAEKNAFQSDLEKLKGQLSSYPKIKMLFKERRPLRNILCRVADAIAMSCPWEEGQEMDYYAHIAYLDGPMIRRKEWFEKTLELPFEVTTMNVPAIYTAALKSRFGANYMNPVHEKSAHDYPFYAKQEEYFQYFGYLKKMPSYREMIGV